MDLRSGARRVLGSSYTLSKRYAQRQMQSSAERRIVVFTMGKTGSTALARAIAAATSERVFQVFRLNPGGVAGAERRFREQLRTRTFPFPGSMHLWESEFLVRYPPKEHARWDVVTSVREPVGQAVSAFFHARTRDGDVADEANIVTLRDRLLAEGWLDRPAQWFEREFAHGLGIDAFANAFDPSRGTAVIEHGAVRVLLVRQENFSEASIALKEFLGTAAPVEIAPRNTGRERRGGGAYERFLEDVRLPIAVVEETYASQLSRHFYSEDELAQLRARWTGVATATPTHRVHAQIRDVPRA